MAKQTMKAIGIAAAETALKSLMPHLQDTLSSVRAEVHGMREKIEAVESRVIAKLEAVESKLGIRIDNVESRLSGRIDSVESKLGTRIEALDVRMRETEGRLELKVDTLRQEMIDRFEATRDTINEVALRVARVDAGLEAYSKVVQTVFGVPRPGQPVKGQGGPKKRRAG